jgi:hypothetical protein
MGFRLDAFSAHSSAEFSRTEAVDGLSGLSTFALLCRFSDSCYCASSRHFLIRLGTREVSDMHTTTTGDWWYGHFERGPGPDRSRPTHARYR